MVCKKEQNKNNSSGALKRTGRATDRRHTLETLLLTVPTTREVTMDALKPDESVSVVLRGLDTIAGYTGGGVQVHEAEER
jgi:hypothetical protein